MSNTIWFMGDCHIGHTNILHLGKGRPFSSVKEMENKIVSNINNKIKVTDILIFLGDTCFGSDKDVKDFLSRINCKTIIEVKGNHSKNGLRHFTLLVNQLTLTIMKQLVIVSHYPYKKPWYKRSFKKCDWDKRRPKNKGHFLIHGHSHSSIKNNGKSINVCVDAWDFQPVSINDIIKIMQKELNKKSCYEKLRQKLSKNKER